MFFLKQGNQHIRQMTYTLYWRQWDMEMALMTIYQVDIIVPEDFIQQLLEESIPVFIYHIIIVEVSLSDVHTFRKA